jgi:isopenicillin-N epimerase
MKTTFPFYSEQSRYWKLDDEIVFLNHGSFGSTPIEVLEKQNQLRQQMEHESVRFMIRELYPLYNESLRKLSRFVGAMEKNMVFVKNATMGVNTIFHSLQFKEGNEILIHSHAYGACVNTIKWYAERQKLKIVIADIPFPIKNKTQIIDAFQKRITSKTKLALVDHITSPTGIIFPVEEIIDSLQSKNIDVLVDGAHAPGQIPLDLEKLKAAYYVGNCHKWICSPKGSGFLYVREDKQKLIDPLQISHLFDAPTPEEKKWQGKFFWPGTDDYTAYCCVGYAIDYFENLLPGGWNEIMNRNQTLACEGRKLLCQELGTEPPAPEDMIANLASVQLGDGILPPYGFNYISPLQEKLFSKYKIEVPVIIFNKENPRTWIRIAAQIYNSMEQIEFLSASIKEIKMSSAY